MSIQSNEILETIRMVSDQHFDVRTITIGIDLHDCISSDIDELNQNIFNKITRVGKDLVETAKILSAKYGVPIVNQRISVTPIAANCGSDQSGFLRFDCPNPRPCGESDWRVVYRRLFRISAKRHVAL